MTKTKDLAADAAAIGFAPFTGGLSLLVSPSVQKFVKGIFGIDEEDNTAKALEEMKLQNEQWKAQMAAHEAEIKRKEEERKKLEENNKKNNDEVARLNSIINDPNRTDEEKKNAKKRIVLLQDKNRKLKKELERIDKEIADKRKKPPTPPSHPWGSYLPKLKFMDKVILAGGIVLITYLLISKDEKRK